MFKYIHFYDLLEHFRSVSFFIGGNVRPAVNEGHADAIPIFLHEIPKMFNRDLMKPDIALIHVTPPDSKGYCSLGTSVDCVRAALIKSKKVVGELTIKSFSFSILIENVYIIYLILII